MTFEQRIIKLIESDELRMRALHAVNTLDLPDWLIAAGFVRNKIWDSLFATDSGINDIDVIYFCKADCSQERDIKLEEQLCELEPDLPWSVKNQVRMHSRHGDEPYKNTLDAMRYWPEKQTSIGAKLDNKDRVVLRHCFDLGLQFSGHINRNPARSAEVFNNRVATKGWIDTWPMLQAKI